MKDKGLKLFIWREIRCDYSCGIGFAMAHNVEEAREVIKKNSEDWEWECHEYELDNSYEMYEAPYGTWISGGG